MQPFTPAKTPTPTPPPSPTPSADGGSGETGTLNGQGVTVQPNTERTSPVPSTGNEPKVTILYSRTSQVIHPTPVPEITGRSVEELEPVTESSAERFEPAIPSSENEPYRQLLSGGTLIGTTILNSRKLENNAIVSNILTPQADNPLLKVALILAKPKIIESLKVTEDVVKSIFCVDDNSDIAQMLNQAGDALKTSPSSAVQDLKPDNLPPFRPPVTFTDTRHSLSLTHGDTVWDRAENELIAFVQGNYSDPCTHLTQTQFFEKMQEKGVDPVLVHRLTGLSNHNEQTQRAVVVIPSEHGFILAGRVMDKEQHRRPIRENSDVMNVLKIFNQLNRQITDLEGAVGELDTMLGQYQAAVFPTLKDLYQSELFGRLMAQYDENHPVQMKIDAVYSPAEKAGEVLRGLRGISTPQILVQQPPLAVHPVVAIPQPETDDGSSGTSEKITEQMTATSLEDEPTDQPHMIGVGKVIVEQSFVLTSEQAKGCLKNKNKNKNNETMVTNYLTSKVSKEDSKASTSLNKTQISLLDIARKKQLSKALDELKSSASSESGLNERLAVKRYLESTPEQTRTRDQVLTLEVLKAKEDEAKATKKKL